MYFYYLRKLLYENNIVIEIRLKNKLFIVKCQSEPVEDAIAKNASTGSA